MTKELSPIEKELLSRADALTDKIGTGLSTAADIAKEQLPDIAMQYIAMYRGLYTFLVLLSILGFIAAYKLITKGIVLEEAARLKGNYSYEPLGHYIPGLIIPVASFLILITNIKNIFMVWLAPKVFIIETLANLVKN